MRLRPATVDDMPELLLIEKSCFGGERFDRRYIEELLDDGDVDVCVAVVKGKIVGSAMVKHEKQEKRSNLLSLALLPREQGRGYSKVMLAKVEELAGERGSRSVYLEVRVENAPAIRLYRNAGYVTGSRLQGFFGKDEDAWKMTKGIEATPDGSRERHESKK
jgi:[ribosomal protein S18]-alanine N-acetyltransferase